MSEHDAKHDPTQWREVWSSNPGDYYADRLEVSPDGALKISAAGRVSCVPSVRALIEKPWRDEKQLLNRVIEIVDYDRERLIRETQDALIGPGHTVDFFEQLPKETRVTWLLRETLRNFLNHGTIRPRFSCVRHRSALACGFMVVVSDEKQFARLDEILAEIASWKQPQ